MMTRSPYSINQYLLTIFVAVIIIMVGLVIIGALVTYWISRLLARLFNTPIPLLAGKHVSTHPVTTFRSISATVLALFAVSFFMTVVGSATTYAQLRQGLSGYTLLQPHAMVLSNVKFTPQQLTQVQHEPYIVSATEVSPATGLMVNCSDLSAYVKTSCPDNPKIHYATLDFEKRPNQVTTFHTQTDPSLAAKRTLPYYLLTVDNVAGIDKIRSLLSNLPGIDRYDVAIDTSDQKQGYLTYSELLPFAYVGLVFSVALSIASLLVTAAGGLLERKRSLATLRMSGLRLGTLQNVLVTESVAPLAVTSLLAAGIGAGVGTVYMLIPRTYLGTALTWTHLWAVLGIVAATTIAMYLLAPLLNKLTLPEANRVT